MRKTKKNSNGKRVFKILKIIFLLLIVCSLVLICLQLYFYKSIDTKNKDLQQDVILIPEYQGIDTETSVPYVDPFDRKIDFDTLRGINPDIKGWIYVPNTPIDYPILIGSDNNTYLHRDYKGNRSQEGSVFGYSGTDLDTSSFVQLFGHNMRSRQMFGSLRNFKDYNYAKTHGKCYIYTPNKTRELDLISVLGTDKNDTMFGVHGTYSDTELQDLIATLQSRGLYNFNVDNGGSVFSLVSCNGKTGTSNRLVVSYSVVKEKYRLD